MSFVPTPEQAGVIDYPLQPLRVAAGAGTGKTATIVHRIARLIRDGLSPERAIGITFTNKAADELSSRLRHILPELAAVGREVEVTTYHGFAYSLLQEYGAIVGVERNTEIIGPGYVRQLLQEAVAAGEYDRLDLTWVPTLVEQAADLAGQLARNLLTPDQALAAGDPGEAQAARLELLGIVSRYSRLKQGLGLVDYDDLILLSHRLLATVPAVAEAIRNRYDVAILDEYQDTDPAQRELLRTLFGDGFPITAVGDADQTIYEWRGASTTNFANFADHFTTRSGEQAATLQLTENRRSGARILAVAHQIRSHIYGEEPFSELRPVPGVPPGEVHARFLRTSVDEAEWIAAEVARLHDEEGTAWRDIAVIFRKNRDMALVRDALQASEVPVEVGSLGGLLDLPDVADLHAWLRTIERPHDSTALARLLLGPRYRLGLGDLAPLSRFIGARRGDNDEDDRGRPLVEALDRLDEIELPDAGVRARLAHFHQLHRRLVTFAQGASLADLCRNILDETGIWGEVEAREKGAALTARVNLYRFLDIAEQWSPLRGRPTLEAFLGYLDAIADDSSAAELDTANVGAEDAVVLLTIHRAKGLEWEAVFVPGLAAGVFPVAGGTMDDPTRLARFLPYELRIDPPVPVEVEGTLRTAALQKVRDRQEWRAAYVAATRARSRLYLSGAHWHGTAKNPRRPSEIFIVATRAAGIHVEPAPATPGARPAALAIVSSHGAPDPVFPDGWGEAMRAAIADPEWARRQAGGNTAYDAAVDQIHMILDDLPGSPTPTAPARPVDTSVTGLVTLADCPQRFYWSEVDPLPRRQIPAMRRGSRIHRLIEIHSRGQLALGDPADDSLYDLAEGGEDSSDHANPYQVYLGSRFAATRPRFVETPIDLLLPTGRVRGRIDAVYEPAPNSWEIVDFKSGRKSDNPAAIVQLEAYAIAAADGAVAPTPPKEMKVTFAYLGGGGLEAVTTVADEAWLQNARRHLAELATAAGGPEYSPVPSARCSRCDFLRFCDVGREFVARSAH